MGRRFDWTRTSWENRHCVVHYDFLDPLYRKGTRIIEEADRAEAERKLAEELEQKAERLRLRVERKAIRRRQKQELHRLQDQNDRSPDSSTENGAPS